MQYGMTNKRRRVERESSAYGHASVKPEINRMPSIGGTGLPQPEGIRPLLAEQPSSQPLTAKFPAKEQGPDPAAVAETTARLARLERLLTLQDHTYAEKRLRLAEEAALRMLEGGAEGSLFGTTSTPMAGQVSHVGNNGRTEIGYSPSHSRGQGHQAQGLRVEIAATGSNVPMARSHATGSVDHDDDAGENHPDSADIKGRFGQWDTVEIIGDAGYTGAEGLNALTAASVLVSDYTFSRSDHARR